jgi:hypothetical protein
MKDCSNKGSTRQNSLCIFCFQRFFLATEGLLAGKNKLIFMIFRTIKIKLFSMAGAKNETYPFSLIFQQSYPTINILFLTLVSDDSSIFSRSGSIKDERSIKTEQSIKILGLTSSI